MCEGDGMEEWKECTLSDLGTIVGGATPSTKDSSNYENGSIAWITPKDLSTHTERFISHGERNITEKGLKSCSAQLMPPNSILFTSRAPIGYIAIAKNEVCTNQGFKSIVPNKDTDFMFLYYLLKYNKDNIENLGSGTTFKEVSGSTMRNVPVKVPPLPTQQKIATILSSLDDKIELNNKINTNLEQQAQALFKNWFVNFEPFGGKMPEGWKECKAEEYFEITIGKTPPRKEQEWFSEEKTNQTMKWVSISDMGSCGLFISDSSEYLTTEAVAKFNVKVVPANTIILSFKLTVGRIAITDDEMCTNEAIAHFGTKNKVINEYLYLYLKNFNYQTMGSTSSIATAVNSKIIKAMPFILPDEKTINDFHLATNSLFEKIRENQHENSTLSTIRDTLLPKLMNGEINI